MRRRHTFLLSLTAACAIIAHPGLATPPPVTQPEPPLVATLDGKPDFLCATADGGFVFASEKKFGRWEKGKAAWQADREIKDKDGNAGMPFREISCDAKGGRLLAFSGQQLVVYDGKTGKILVDQTRTKEGQVEYDHALMMPTGDILLIERTLSFAACAVVKDGLLKKELRRTKVDPELDQWSISPDGKRLNYIASLEKGLDTKQTICIREFGIDRDVLLRGRHFTAKTDGLNSFAIDTPFYSGILHDGKRYLLLALDSQMEGRVYLFDWKKKDPIVIPNTNFHLIMAADFAHNRFAVAGARNHLTVHDMAGAVIHEIERLPGERTCCLSFSPDGKSLLIGDTSGEIRRVTLPK